jgi:thiol-disulfide isomerase/thioredoxin
MHLYILLGVLVLMLVIIRLYGRSVLGFKNRQEGFASGSELIIVKAEWCGHCKKAKNEFVKLVKASPVKMQDGSEVTIRMLDSDENKDEVSALNVKGFPTILYRSGSDRQEYPGERTYDGVMGFLKQM